MVNHGKTLNIFPTLTRTTKTIQGVSECGNPVKNVASPFAILRVPGLAMTWGEGSTAVSREVIALARESVCSFPLIPAWTGTNWKVWVALLENEKAYGQTFQGNLGRRDERVESRERPDFESERERTDWKLQVVLWFLHQTRPSSRAKVSSVNWRQLDRRRRKETRRSWRAFKI